ncbi:MAG: glycosyl transferase family 2 [Nitrospirae bacterium]|nr:glycosyl transferase family 2 [Nitrospirota bacterium]
MDNVEISIVIPVYNEANTLTRSLPEIGSFVRGTGFSYEIIVIDDGSRDGTWDILRTISHKDQKVSAIKLSRNFGKESAIAAGLEFASGSAVIIMDGDLQHPPEIIPEMIRLWKQEGVDIVEAVKADRGSEHISSKIGAKLFYWLMNHLSELDLDNSSDFKLLDRQVVTAHNKLPESSRFFRGIVSWLGFKKAQIPFSVKDRISGRSRWSIFRLVKLAINASTSFSSLPLHIITYLGIITFGISIVLGIQTLSMKFSGAAVSGFTTVILLLLFIGSVLMLSLGIIGLYISRIFEEVKRRPVFIIEKALNMEKR